MPQPPRAQSEPRQPPPPAQGGTAPPASPAVPVGVAAGVPATAVAVGGAAAQSAFAVGAVLAGLRRFFKRKEQDEVPFLASILEDRYPDITPEEIQRAITAEIEREREFQRRVFTRVERDLIAADGDPARIQAVLDRERRYLDAREKAMADRIVAAQERHLLRKLSPNGAYWRLSPNVKEHTLDCLAMGGKFWPWDVLDLIHPPLHPGCPCMLFGEDEAKRRGWLSKSFQPPSAGDAMHRAKKAIDLAQRAMQECTAEEISEYVDGLALEEVLRGERKRYDLRFAKGTVKGGKFRPRRGGSAPRVLRRLLPRLPHTGAGPDPAIGNAQITTVDAADLGLSPERLAQLQGIIATRTIAAERGMDAAIENALEAMDPMVPPVGISERAPFVDPLIDHGFKVMSYRQDEVGGEMREAHMFVHAESGSSLLVISSVDGVSEAFWNPGAYRDKPREMRTEPPSSVEELRTDALGFADFVAEHYDKGKTIAHSIEVDQNVEDHNGFHRWDGSITLGEAIPESLDSIGDQSHEARAAVYQTYETTVHEIGHSVNPPMDPTVYKGGDLAIEEALTEETAHPLTYDRLFAHGLTDVVAADLTVPQQGTYRGWRRALDSIFTLANINPEDREQIYLDLKFKADIEDRREYLARLLAEGTGLTPDWEAAPSDVQTAALAHVDMVLGGAEVTTNPWDSNDYVPALARDGRGVTRDEPLAYAADGAQITVGSVVNSLEGAATVRRITRGTTGPQVWLSRMDGGPEWFPVPAREISSVELAGERVIPAGGPVTRSGWMVGDAVRFKATEYGRPPIDGVATIEKIATDEQGISYAVITNGEQTWALPDAPGLSLSLEVVARGDRHGDDIREGDRVWYGNTDGSMQTATVENILNHENSEWWVQARLDNGKLVSLCPSRIRTPLFTSESRFQTFRESGGGRVEQQWMGERFGTRLGMPYEPPSYVNYQRVRERGNVIAIDGPSGSGKSTVAKAVAENLGARYVDTGALFRTAALAQSRGEDPLDAIRDMDVVGSHVVLHGEDVSEQIRTHEIDMGAAALGGNESVRAAVGARVAEIVDRGGLAVVEGRDAAESLSAAHRVYLTADIMERADRRAADRGEPVNEVAAAISERDKLDSVRLIPAQRRANVTVDSTGNTFDETVAAVTRLTRERLGTPEPTVRLYHGTSSASLERGVIEPRDPAALAHDIEDEFGLPRDSVLNHVAFMFSRERDTDREVYLSLDRRTAEGYAAARSEMVTDALTAAWRVLNPPPEEQTQEWREQYGRDYAEWRDAWFAKHDMRPVVLAVDVPLSEIEARSPDWEYRLGEHEKRKERGLAEPDEITVQSWLDAWKGTGTVRLTGPVPLEWTTVSTKGDIGNANVVRDPLRAALERGDLRRITIFTGTRGARRKRTGSTKDVVYNYPDPDGKRDHLDDLIYHEVSEKDVEALGPITWARRDQYVEIAKPALANPQTHYVPEAASEEGEYVYEGDIATRWRQKHEVLVDEALNRWKGWPSDFRLHADDERAGAPQPGSGGGKRMRAEAGALLWELANHGKVNDVPLYRGDHRDPAGIQAWSESRKVAEAWAKKNNGTVHVLAPGEGKGLRVMDYLGDTPGLDMAEREWVIDTPVKIPPQIGNANAPAGGTPDIERFIGVSLEARAMGGMKTPDGWKYGSVAELVLKEGRPWTPQPLPAEAEPWRGEKKQCYKNAADAVLGFGGKPEHPDWRYVEGFVAVKGVPFPIAHAWAVDPADRVIELTLDDPGYEYRGILFSDDQLRGVLLRRGMYGVLDNWENDYPLLKDGVNPGGPVGNANTVVRPRAIDPASIVRGERAWGPGTSGKGFIEPDGTVTTWSVTGPGEGPDHLRIAIEQGRKGEDYPLDAERIIIRPSGWFVTTGRIDTSTKEPVVTEDVLRHAGGGLKYAPTWDVLEKQDRRWEARYGNANTPTRSAVPPMPDWESYGDPMDGLRAVRAWKRALTKEISLGRVDELEAKAAGWSESDARESVDPETGKRRERIFQPLPAEMFHVTTAKTAVLADRLRSREELEQLHGGHGLGGGSDQTISITTDEAVADGIRNGLLEIRSLLRGEVTLGEMMERADRGDLGSKPFGREMRSYLFGGGEANRESWEYAFKGLELVKSINGTGIDGIDTFMGGPAEVWRAAGVEPVGEPNENGWYTRGTRPLDGTVKPGATASPLAARVADFYRAYSLYREKAGGPPDPLFFGSDYEALAAMDPDEVAVLKLRPAPGALGYPVSGMGEWRVHTGDALEIVQDVTPSSAPDTMPTVGSANKVSERRWKRRKGFYEMEGTAYGVAKYDDREWFVIKWREGEPRSSQSGENIEFAGSMAEARAIAERMHLRDEAAPPDDGKQGGSLGRFRRGMVTRDADRRGSSVRNQPGYGSRIMVGNQDVPREEQFVWHALDDEALQWTSNLEGRTVRWREGDGWSEPVGVKTAKVVDNDWVVTTPYDREFTIPDGAAVEWGEKKTGTRDIAAITAARFGLEVGAYNAETNQTLKDLLHPERAHVAVRITPLALDRFLFSDGHYRSAVDPEHMTKDGTPKADGYVEHRRDWETKVFGDHPIYGYMAEDDEDIHGSNVKTFGEVKLRLRDDVRDRTTFVYSDSNFLPTAEGEVTPTPVNSPGYQSVYPALSILGLERLTPYKDMKPNPPMQLGMLTAEQREQIEQWDRRVERARFSGDEADLRFAERERERAWEGFTEENNPRWHRWPSEDFFEAQIHGGLKPEDVAEVIFPEAPFPDVQRELDRREIPWRVETFDSPPIGNANVVAAPAFSATAEAPEGIAPLALEDARDIWDGFVHDGMRVGIWEDTVHHGSDGKPVQARIRASIFDTKNPDSTKHGALWREISNWGDDIIVTHEELFLPPSMQGRGFATALNAHAEEEYRRMGVHHIQVRAVRDGKYAWASQGYLFGKAEDGHPFRWSPRIGGRAAAELFKADSLSNPQDLANRIAWDMARFQDPGEGGRPSMDELREIAAEFAKHLWTKGRLDPDFHFTTEAQIAMWGRERTWTSRDGHLMWPGKAALIGTTEKWVGLKPVTGSAVLEESAVALTLNQIVRDVAAEQQIPVAPDAVHGDWEVPFWDEVERRLNADPPVIEEAFDPRQARYPKGHPKAGQWRPKIGAGVVGKQRTSKGWLARDIKGLTEMIEEATHHTVTRLDPSTGDSVTTRERKHSVGTDDLTAVGAQIDKLAARYSTAPAYDARVQQIDAEVEEIEARQNDAWSKAIEQWYALPEWRPIITERPEGFPESPDLEEFITDAERAKLKALYAERGKVIVEKQRAQRDAIVGVLSQVRDMGGATLANGNWTFDRDDPDGQREIEKQGERRWDHDQRGLVYDPVPDARALTLQRMREVCKLLPTDWVKDANEKGKVHLKISRARAHCSTPDTKPNQPGRFTWVHSWEDMDRRTREAIEAGTHEWVGYTERPGTAVEYGGDGKPQQVWNVLRYKGDGRYVWVDWGGTFHSIAGDDMDSTGRIETGHGPMHVKRSKGIPKRNMEWDSTIRIDPRHPDTFLHEILHRLERVYGERGVAGWTPLERMTQEFLRKRTWTDDGEALRPHPLVKLRDLRPNQEYEEDEVTRPDEFFDPYVGKDYAGDATEVLTMGVTEVFFPRADLDMRAKDPEHYRLMLGALAAL